MQALAHCDSLGTLLEAACGRFSERPALVEINRDRETSRSTYAQLKSSADQVGHALDAQGFAVGDLAAILMGNQSKWLVAASGVFFRGGVVVPVDYKLSAEEQAALLNHAQPRALFVDWPLWKRLLDTSAEIPVEASRVWVIDAPREADLGQANRWESMPPGHALPAVRCAREDIATVVYSSGTGGTPKGCQLTHGNYLAQLEALVALYPIEGGDRYFSILPTNHAIDFMCGFIGPLYGGATVVHQRTLRPEFILSTMKSQRITHMAVVPLLLEAFERAIRDKLAAQPVWKQLMMKVLEVTNARLSKHSPKPRLSRLLLKPIHDGFGGSLKLMFAGGAFVEPGRVEFFYRLGIPVVVGYGLTEACTVLTVNRTQPFRHDSVGQPIQGVQLRIDSPDAHGVGEVWVKSPTVMRGYLRDPELTQKVLKHDWLRTGDLGRLDTQGCLHLLGRTKNMIVTRGGKNVYPEDIEQVFSQLAVGELAVFARDYIWPSAGGESLGQEALVAVLRPPTDGQTDASSMDNILETLREANQRLPDFKRIRAVLPWFEAFPRTASMKVKRDALALEIRERTQRDSLLPL